MITTDHLPHEPGCYLFENEEGTVLYVGKARDLKKRIASYFQKQDHPPKTKALVSAAKSVSFIATNNEVEALLLENNLIKKHSPRYNIKLKDSSRYACIHLTDEAYPRICISRKKEEKGSFFGPFVSSKERDYVFSVVKKTFGLRSCRRLPKRACLRYHLSACSAPCIGMVSEEAYMENVKRAQSVLRGNIGRLIEDLTVQMKRLAQRSEFEQAILIRDEISSLRRLQERQSIEKDKKYDQDVLNYIADDEFVHLMIFKVYKGTLEEKEEFVFDRHENFLEEFLVQYYSENEPPEELILPENALEPEAEKDAQNGGVQGFAKEGGAWSMAEYLSGYKGRKVRITAPKQGDKKGLLDIARKNIEMTFFRDKEKVSRLQEALNLSKEPNTIECFDISHISGTATVGSMVVFRGGRADKSGYRRYRIKTVDGIDDPASIAEVVRRRYSRILEEGGRVPDLVIIDGGPVQLHAALAETKKLLLEVPIISIAKRDEEIFVPGRQRPLDIKRDDKASLFVQEIRDEAHRFAVNYHRLLRGKNLKE